MAVRIPMSAEVLGRSRFGVSPAAEVVGVVRASHGRGSVAPHVARWCERARRSVPTADMNLLSALVPDAGYVLDLLTPPPTALVMTIEDETAAVAATVPGQVEYQLGIAYQGQPVNPEVAESFGGQDALEQARRPMPRPVAAALEQGHEVFVARVAEALLTFFDGVLGPEWERVLDALVGDVAYRGDRMAKHGVLALMDDLHPGVVWDSDAVRLERPFHVEVDWAHDGLLLIPSATAGRKVWFNAERPTAPSIIYPARGTQELWAHQSMLGIDEVGELLGHTRAVLLAALECPRTTAELGRSQALTASTVSYHLGILHRSGLVSRRRLGRRVVYARTELGTAIMHRDSAS